MDTLQIQHVVHWGSNPSEDKAKPTVTNDPWRKSTTGEPLQRIRTEHSGRVQQQVKFKTTSTKFKSTSTKFQEHATNKHVMLWSSAAGVFHMALPSFSWPLGSYIIGSSLYLSSSYLQHVQIKCNKLQEHPKTEQWKTVNKLNCKTMTTVKTVAYIVQWVHMCPTACKWHQTTYKWKQLTSNPKQWNEHHKTWKSKTVATVKNLQNQCTASAR